MATEEERNAILDTLSLGFSGYCYGMSLSVLLDKKGFIDFNGNFANSANNMYEVPRPTLSSNKHIFVRDFRLLNNASFPASESTIAFYQVAFRLHSQKREYQIDIYNSESCKPIIDSLRTYGGILFSYYYPNPQNTDELIAHAVVAYGMPVRSGDYYQIKYYDPNLSGEQVLKISSDYSTCIIPISGASAITPTTIRYWADFSPCRSLDVDGDYNIYSYSTTQSSNAAPLLDISDSFGAYSLSGEIWLSFDASAAITIVNAEGNQLVYSGGMISGDMEVLDKDLICKGDNLPVSVRLRVPYSSSFTYNVTETQSSFGVNWEGNYYTMEGYGIQRIVFSPSGIAAFGNNMNYTVCASAGLGSYRKFSVTGNNESNINLSVENGEASIWGNSTFLNTLYDVNLQRTILESQSVDGSLVVICDPLCDDSADNSPVVTEGVPQQ